MKKKQSETTEKKQLEFDRDVLFEKRFTIDKLVNSKLNQLADRMHVLTYQQLVWLSRIEDFHFKYEYLTERQIEVLDSIVLRSKLST